MKTFRIILALTLLAVQPLRAQIVADGATRTLINETNSIPGTVTVGTNGAFTLLVLSDNALLTNSVNGVIGLNLAARSNEVRLISPTARWRMGGSLFVGSNGAMNRLVVSNGAFLENNSGIVGSRLDASNNLALVTGSGSLWSNRSDLTVGIFGRNNQLIVSNGGWVASQSGTVGNTASASNNLALVTGSGSVWSNTINLFVGFSGQGNRLVIEAGGRAHCDAGTVGSFSSASDNQALVTGPGSLWTNRSSLTIGGQAPRNRLVVSNGATVWSGTGTLDNTNNQVVVTGTGSLWSNQTFLSLGGRSNRVDVSDGGWLACNDGSFIGSSNTVVLTGGASGWNNLGGLIVGAAGSGNVLLASNGATVLSSNATIGMNGSTANNNLAVITGGGTLWSNQTDLVVGSFGVGNRLQVENGATVLASNLFVGFNSIATDNRLIVDGGTLRANVLDMRRGFSNFLNAGVIEAGQLLVTNNSGRFTFTGGTLAVGQLTIANGLSFDVGNGVSPATLNLTGDGTHSFSSVLIIRANATLMGNGTILLPVVLQSGSTLSPGAAQGAVGRLASSGSVVLGGTSIMEISKSGSGLTNDQFQVANILTYVNALVVVSNLGPTALTAGDRFQLFPAASYAGSLPSITLPPLQPGLVWTNKLLVDGSIEVVDRAPVVTTLSASPVVADMARLNGSVNPRGTETTAWFEFGSTTNYGNVTVPQPLGSGTNSTNFNQTVSGLMGGTYHFRAVASNTFVVVFGGDQSFSIGPTVTTQPANPVLADLAGLNGTANPRRVNTAVWFEWGTTTNYGNVTVPQPLGSGTNNANFTQFLSDLTAGTYHFRAVASNNLNVVFGIDRSFSIGPTVTTQPAVVNGTTSTLNGTANPNAESTTAWFEWGTTTNYGSTTPPQPLGSGTNSVSFSEFVSGLTVGTYHFRAAASNSLALVFGGDRSFNLGPTVQTQPVTPLDAATAALNGLANPQGSNTTVWFEWGTTPNYGNITPPQLISGGTNSTNFSEVLTGLTATATYHFRAVASNSLAVVFGIDRNFRTLDAYLKASNSGTIDLFGNAIAMSVDTLVVGAPNESSNATGVNGNQTNNNAGFSGAAYVFVRNGASWSQQAYLKASNTGAGDVFGFSVAVSGDTVVIGATGEDSNATGVNGDGSNNTGTNSGAAYVFVRSGTNWTQQAYLKASNTGVADAFGVSVAVSGDTIVVGASGEDSNATGVTGDGNNNTATDAGAAYVFVRSGSVWSQQAYLKASNTGQRDNFGDSVSVSGDTVLIGATLEDSSATGVNGDGNDNSSTNAGAAYVFVRNGSAWSQQAYLKAGNTGQGDNFGDSVSVSGDTVLIGATLEDSGANGVNSSANDNSATNSGAAYVFVRNGTNWGQQAYLKASNTEVGDFFGTSVAVSGDTVVVGASSDDSDANGVNGDQNNNLASASGAAYVFARSGTTWIQRAYLKASNPESSDNFGGSVAVSGDTVVVGANLENSNATGVNGDQNNNNAGISGAVYVLGALPPPAPLLTIVGSTPGQVTLSWIPPLPGFVLQESLDLPALGWSNSSSGETNPITVPVTGPTKFYRLLKP